MKSSSIIICRIALQTTRGTTTVFAVQKKESPNVKCDRWTLLKLYNKNFILINRDFFAVGQLNKPFSAVVINDDAVAMTFPWE